jgi:hypothetical protein
MRVERYGHRHTIGVTRRELLQVGYSGLLGAGLTSTLAPVAASAAKRTGRAKSMILVFLTGGAPQHEMFDPKPDAPAEVRGEFNPIETCVPGIRVGEHIPGFAKRMDRLAIVRTLCHKNDGHLPATHWVLTGRAMPGLPENVGADKIRSRTDWPSYASALDYFYPRTDGAPNGVNLPTYLQEPPLLWPGQYAGCMGPKHDPWQITDDPNKPGFRVQNLSLPSGFTVDRLQTRRSLLECVNGQQDRLARLAETRSLADKQRDAFTLLTSGAFAEAFRIEKEPDAVRDRYGRHMFGQSLLLARRLVEAGVPIVQANMGIVQTWDLHAATGVSLKKRLLPPLDTGVGALLDDLKERGLLDETLVIVVGEFGRTPTLNKDAGRDHWSGVFSAAFAGAGIRGGQVIGASDAQGGAPATQGYTPDDLGATVYQLLGINPAAEFFDTEGRPQRLSLGQPIEPLFSGA